MAGSNSQKQLLSLIRDFSSEKSQGEWRIVNQKKRIEELRSELETETRKLEEAKRVKEKTEQELKGYEVELSMDEASIDTLEKTITESTTNAERISLTKNEISKLGSELADMKNEENCLRDGFIKTMLDLNSQIRKFHELLASTFNAKNSFETPENNENQHAQKAREDLEHEIAQMVLSTTQEGQQYKAEKVIHDKVQQELVNLEKKVLLLESVMKESLELQELARSELESQCASLGEELQKRFICPSCNKDNSQELGKILQMID